MTDETSHDRPSKLIKNVEYVAFLNFLAYVQPKTKMVQYPKHTIPTVTFGGGIFMCHRPVRGLGQRNNGLN